MSELLFERFKDTRTSIREKVVRKFVVSWLFLCVYESFNFHVLDAELFGIKLIHKYNHTVAVLPLALVASSDAFHKHNIDTQFIQFIPCSQFAQCMQRCMRRRELARTRAHWWSKCTPQFRNLRESVSLTSSSGRSPVVNSQQAPVLAITG